MATPTPMALLAYPDNARCMKIKLTAAYAGVPLTEPEFNFGDSGDCDNKAPAYIRNAHPLGKVPVLETPEGYIFESFAITRYLARLSNKGLYGTSPYAAAQVDQWLDFAQSELSSSVVVLMGPILKLVPYNATQSELAMTHIKKCLAGMDTWLETRTFFVGERITVADIALVCTLLPAFQYVFRHETVRPYVNLTRWFDTCINQPLFQQVLRPGKLLECEKKEEKKDDEKAKKKGKK